jgi:hypothetical protein
MIAQNREFLRIRSGMVIVFGLSKAAYLQLREVRKSLKKIQNSCPAEQQ